MVVVWVCPETSPQGPKTTACSASLGRLRLTCILETGVFVSPWTGGRWEERHMQPGFSMGCSGHLLPKPEGLESERHKGEAFC